MIKMRYPEKNYIKCVFGVEFIGTHVAMIVELPENRDRVRVSELYEHLATKVYRTYFKEIDPLKITWLEYYPPISLKVKKEAITPVQKNYGIFSQVELKYDHKTGNYYDPTWNWIPHLVAINRYGISINELMDSIREVGNGVWNNYQE
ncbi:MAG: hypothetical protein D6726_06960 [Nitrospirae bacterium]|nr:MAG: hypothetical protein D6726_06960 [Nitrospirota bacterium]